MEYTPQYIQRDETFRRKEEQIEKIIKHIINLSYIKEQISNKVTTQNPMKEEINEVETKIDNCYELIERVCGDDEILQYRYLYFENEYEMKFTNIDVDENKISEVVGKENIRMYHQEETISKDKTTRTITITMRLKNAESVRKLNEWRNKTFMFELNKKQTLQLFMNKTIQKDLPYNSYHNSYQNQRWNSTSEVIEKREKDILYTELIDSIVSLGYTFENAVKILNVLSVGIVNITEIAFYLLEKDKLKERCAIVAEELNKFEFNLN